MGAVVHDDCVSFRVWAPNAERGCVAGDFNEWSDEGESAGERGERFLVDGRARRAAGAGVPLLACCMARMICGGRTRTPRALTNSIGNSVIVDPAFDWEDGDFKMPPWNELVIYEMHVGTFHVTEPGKPGTFLTAIEKLDYLRDSGHQCDRGDAADGVSGRLLVGLQRRRIPLPSNARTAGRIGLKRFVNEAHKRGIAVLLDVVYNHVGPNDNALWQFDGWSENGDGGIYFYNDWRAETPWGDTRPDYGRGEVRQYFRDNALMWLEEYHCDGLRFDATAFIRHVYGNHPRADRSTNYPKGGASSDGSTKRSRRGSRGSSPSRKT